jgi:hypothetical protein
MELNTAPKMAAIQPLLVESGEIKSRNEKISKIESF